MSCPGPGAAASQLLADGADGSPSDEVGGTVHSTAFRRGMVRSSTLPASYGSLIPRRGMPGATDTASLGGWLGAMCQWDGGIPAVEVVAMFDTGPILVDRG